jgi:hypothetical protein
MPIGRPFELQHRRLLSLLRGPFDVGERGLDASALLESWATPPWERR